MAAALPLCYNTFMISHLLGTVAFSGDKYVVLDVEGVGYRVNTTLENVRVAGKNNGAVQFFTHLAVRENAMDLYGFLTRAELEFFELLITVSGIGPKTALGIMNVAPLETLLTGISGGDSVYLTKVSGIGAKNAQKIVLELKDKIGVRDMADGSGGSAALKEEGEVLEALQSLGYSLAEAREALKDVPEKEGKSVQEKIREVLKTLGKHK